MFRLFEDKEIVLVETGMGAAFAAAALESVSAYGPDLVVFAGFCGGLHPTLAVGDVCVAKKTVLVHPEHEDAGLEPEVARFESLFPDLLSGWFENRGIRPVTAVTVNSPPDKKRLSAVVGGGLAVVDMETAELAQTALHKRIPFLCLRAVSDSLDDDLGFELHEITDVAGRVDILKVLRLIARKPLVIYSFCRLWLGSRRAGANLGSVLVDLIRIPATQLRGIASGIESTAN